MMDLTANQVIAAFTVILVAVTAVYAYFTYKIVEASQRQADTQARSLGIQNRLLHAQILGQRLELYWKLFAPITDEELADVALLPGDWMDPERFETKYKTDKDALRRYVKLSRCYEYLAMTSTMRKLDLPDPLGDRWTELWARDLAQQAEFGEINSWYGAYYPEFARFVDEAIGKRTDVRPVPAGKAHDSAGV